MRRILLSLLTIIVVVGLFATIGYAGYRLGYARGAQGAPSIANGDDIPRLRPFDDFGPRGMPGRDFGFERRFHPGFGMRVFPRLGFGLFSPLRFLGQILSIGLIAGLVYWLLTRSGWRLTRTPETTEPPVQPAETEARNTNQDPLP